jgi:UDP-N-acetylmuramoyl-tripeptide--D-alanyl-D-alanine ligase
MAVLDLAQIAQWLECQGAFAGQISGYRQDSRAVQLGDLFFAIKGETVDGHDYLGEVAARGGAAAVVSREYSGEEYGLQLLRVASVTGALHQLAKTVHALRLVRVIGVTGSVGKTTTKEFIVTLLEGKFRVAKTPGNANSQVGIPLSVLNAAGSEEVFVMEMGMSFPGEITKLVAIAPPEVALVTKVALAHAAHFTDGLEGIARAKMEILSHPATRIGILNCQAAGFSAAMRGSCLKMTYGIEEEGCDFILQNEGDCITVIEKEGRSPPFSLPFSATHLQENILGAVAVARAMGMQWSEILPQLPKLTLFMRRFERVERDGIIFINDSYNANPTSMQAALANLPSPQPGKKRIGVLGAMKELGSFEDEGHREVAHAALGTLDHLLCLGEECLAMVEVFEKAGRPVEHFLELAPMKRRLYALVQEGDVVLLKGSNSKKLWLVLEES